MGRLTWRMMSPHPPCLSSASIPGCSSREKLYPCMLSILMYVSSKGGGGGEGREGGEGGRGHTLDLHHTGLRQVEVG